MVVVILVTSLARNARDWVDGVYISTCNESVSRWNNCVCSLSWYRCIYSGVKPEQLPSWYTVELTLCAPLGLQAQCIVAISMNLTKLYLPNWLVCGKVWKCSKSLGIIEQAVQEMDNIESKLMEETTTSVWFEGLCLR